MPSSVESREALTIDDLEERKELAKILNIPEVPRLDDLAFDEILGIFDDLMKEEKVDAVEWVKSLRRRQK